MEQKISDTYKHYFKVIKGKFIWKDPEMFQLKRKQMEGSEGYALIKEEEEDKSMNQLGYYFQGIIRMECMNSNVFGGWTEGEIHSHLLKEIEGKTKYYTLPDGTIQRTTVIPDFKKFSKKKLSQYIEDVIIYLNTEMQIYPKTADSYKNPKFKI